VCSLEIGVERGRTCVTTALAAMEGASEEDPPRPSDQRRHMNSPPATTSSATAATATPTATALVDDPDPALPTVPAGLGWTTTPEVQGSQ
jgi:hypothetical protein